MVVPTSSDPIPPPPVVPRWGLGDALWVWFAALAVALVAGGLLVGLRGSVEPGAWDIIVGTVAQNGAMVGFVAIVSRAKGAGSLRRDFGFVVHARDWAWAPIGAGISVATSVAMVPITNLLRHPPEQEVVRIVGDSRGLAAVLAALAVTFVAPLGEELLARGLVLRSLQRRFEPWVAVLLSSLLFALVHPLLDPRAILAVVPLLVLSLVSGIQAVRTGDLSRSIWLHVGFNALAAIGLVLR